MHTHQQGQASISPSSLSLPMSIQAFFQLDPENNMLVKWFMGDKVVVVVVGGGGQG